MSRERREKGPRHVNGFDLETPYEGAGRLAWNSFLDTLDPQTACRLCGVDHFPHWLASSANWQLLIEYLSKHYPDEMPVRQALCLAIQERKPDPKSEQAAWWKAMEHVVPDLERFAYLYCHGLIKPQSEAMCEEGWQAGVNPLTDSSAPAVMMV
jgi:hypothetical protein